jgi:thiamine kinase-like enzyme
LLDRLSGLLDGLPRRADDMARFGGPETLLHGDLWRPNIVPMTEAGIRHVRLLDWDHAGVGPIAYDISTLLLRFPPNDRPALLELYRQAVEPAGLTLADPDRLNAVFDTAERGRIANRVIWPAVATIEGDRRWGPAALAEIEGWFGALAPVLPEGLAR